MSIDNEWVKVCGVTSATDAALVVASGANALGLIFAPSSKRLVHRDNVEGILASGAAIRCVGVFKDCAEADIVSHVATWQLSAVQLHDDPSDDLLRDLRDAGVSLIIGAVAAEALTDQYDETRFDALLVDAASPGSGNTFEWSTFAPRPLAVPLIVAGGLSPANVGDCIRAFEPSGVDVASGTEASPGVKDPEKVAKFITQAREAWSLRGDA